MYIGSSIDDTTNIVCFSSLSVARDKLCQEEKRSISHPTTESSNKAQAFCHFFGVATTGKSENMAN
jgi:hypothetical protein